jgi:photosystem II stability/assembly factor-like uncharacterized protein
VTWTGGFGGGGQFVAVGYGDPAAILTSAGGTTWVPQASGTNLPLLDVAFNGGDLVAVGLNGVVLRSDYMGVTWTREDWATESSLHDVDWVANQFIAVGDRGAIVRQPCTLAAAAP